MPMRVTASDVGLRDHQLRLWAGLRRATAWQRDGYKARTERVSRL